MTKERATLQVSDKSWHGRVYLNWYRRAEYKNHRGYRENLCHYVRVILIWAPLNWFFKSTHGKTGWEPFWVPVFGLLALGLLGLIWEHTWRVPATIAFVAVVIGVIFGIGLGIEMLRERAKKRRWAREDAEARGEYPTKDEGFGGVIWRFFDAKKAKICPFIEVEGRDRAKSW